MSGRCKACNVKLSEFELTRKYAESGTYVDLCNHCLGSIPNFPDVIERSDLDSGEDCGYELGAFGVLLREGDVEDNYGDGREY